MTARRTTLTVIGLTAVMAGVLGPATAAAAPTTGSSGGDLIAAIAGILGTGSAAPQAPAGPNVIPVGTKIAVPVGSGRTLGPGLYALTDGKADVAFSWKAAAPGGNDKGCQMEVTVSGPATFPTVRTSDCTGYYATSFNGSDNGVTIKIPGRYTVTANDRVSKTSGVAALTVQ